MSLGTIKCYFIRNLCTGKGTIKTGEGTVRASEDD